MGTKYLVPYTNLHELNLDWLINAMKTLETEWDAYGTSATATAEALEAGEDPTVEITGSFKSTVNFDFGIPSGADGDDGTTFTPSVSTAGVISWTNDGGKTNPDPVNIKGPTGDTGPQGPAGTGLYILDVYATLADLQAAHPTGLAGDAYLVGTSPNFTLYVWSTTSSAWTAAGSLTSPSPSPTTPLMDADTATTGTENRYARGDHAHPKDTSKLDKRTNDGTKTELYAYAGSVQNGIELTDVPSAGKVAMYDQVSGNLQSGVSEDPTDVVIHSELDDYQPLLSSGVNIKTINSTGILGAGDIAVQPVLESGTNIKTINNNSILGSGNLSITTPMAGIDTTNVIYSTSGATTAVTYTATADSIAVIGYSSYSSSGITLNGVNMTLGMNNTGYRNMMILPLKTNDVLYVWANSGNPSYIYVYGTTY